MRAYLDVVSFRQGQSFAHGYGVACVKTTGNIGLVNVRHHLLIQTHGPAAVTFSKIAIQ
jgi:hypothetical protein